MFCVHSMPIISAFIYECNWTLNFSWVMHLAIILLIWGFFFIFLYWHDVECTGPVSCLEQIPLEFLVILSFPISWLISRLVISLHQLFHISVTMQDILDIICWFKKICILFALILTWHGMQSKTEWKKKVSILKRQYLSERQKFVSKIESVNSESAV